MLLVMLLPFFLWFLPLYLIPPVVAKPLALLILAFYIISLWGHFLNKNRS